MSNSLFKSLLCANLRKAAARHGIRAGQPVQLFAKVSGETDNASPATPIEASIRIQNSLRC